MSVNSINSTNSINPIQNNNRQMKQNKLDIVKEKFGDDSFQFSAASKMMNFMSGLSAQDRREIKIFRSEMMQSLKSGNTDFAEMAEKAPQPIKKLSEENGLNLEEALRKMAGRKGNMSAKVEIDLPLEAFGTEELSIMELLFSDHQEKEDDI